MKGRRQLASAVLYLTVGLVVFGAAQTERKLIGKVYVTADRLNVRLSPSPSGKVTNVLDRGQGLDVLEVKNGWARISRYYDGSIEGVRGEVARWVAARHLPETNCGTC